MYPRHPYINSKFKTNDFVLINVAGNKVPAIVQNVIWDEAYGYWDHIVLVCGKLEISIHVNEDKLESISEKEYIIMKVMFE